MFSTHVGWRICLYKRSMGLGVCYLLIFLVDTLAQAEAVTFFLLLLGASLLSLGMITTNYSMYKKKTLTI